jgi:FkbM family methyltransferase
MHLEYSKQYGLWYRPNGQDLNVAKSIGHLSEYGALPIGGSVLDIGGHIGAFALWSQSKGATTVLSFEPDHENFCVMMKNFSCHDERLAGINKAVMSDPAPATITLFRSQRSEASHSLYNAPGREPIDVSVIGLNAIFEFYQPDVLKVDVEGYEYKLLGKPFMIPKCVKALAVECHLTRKLWQQECQQLLPWIEEQGFKPLKPTTGGRWKGHYGGTGVWSRY